MNINVHGHLFTLRTVLSREAVSVMTQRLRDRGLPELMVSAVSGLLEDLLDRPELLDERELLARLLGHLRGASGFDAFVERRLSRLPFELAVRGEGLEELSVGALRQALDQLTTAMRDEGDPAMRPYDLVETLRLAARGTITEVADALLEQMEPEDALVALMMDIRAPDEPERDRLNFLRQVEGTREAALQRPGRILPFFAIHPDRPDHFELMEAGVEEGAFLGVKLYPSLGYTVDSPELRRVFEFCVDRDVPILLHCSHGGFYRRKEFIDYCDPAHWEKVLQGELSELRVCFAHFGGWDALGRPGGLDENTWGGRILRLMREKPQAYTDLAFHTDQMHDPEDEEHYFTTLEELLQEEGLEQRILFGTDSWLLRMEMTEELFWKYYRERMPPESFRKIAELGPRAFLGFPEKDGSGGGDGSNEQGEAPRANIQRHVDFLVRNREKVGTEPASWVVELADVSFHADREPPDWRRRTYPTQCTYRLAREYMTGAQKRGGYGANRELRLNELRYFRPRDPNFPGVVCGGLARDLVGCCVDGGGAFAPGWDRNRAVGRLQEVFRKGEKRLVDVAVLLDTIFHFEEALV